jgi:hypothetical protein
MFAIKQQTDWQHLLQPKNRTAQADGHEPKGPVVPGTHWFSAQEITSL